MAVPKERPQPQVARAGGRWLGLVAFAITFALLALLLWLAVDRNQLVGAGVIGAVLVGMGVFVVRRSMSGPR